MASVPGSIPGSAPNKILTILGDQPIGSAQNSKGEVLNVYPTMAHVQMLQRIVSYIGQPGTSSAGNSLSEQVSSVVEVVNSSTASVQSNLSDVQTLSYFAVLTPPLQAQAASPAIYAPLVNGDSPGSVLPGYPVGMIKGPTLMSDPYGQAIMVQIR